MIRSIINTGISEAVEDYVILLVATHKLLGVEVADGKLARLEEEWIFDGFSLGIGVLPGDLAELTIGLHHAGLQCLPEI